MKRCYEESQERRARAKGRREKLQSIDDECQSRKENINRSFQEEEERIKAEYNSRLLDLTQRRDRAMAPVNEEYKHKRREILDSPQTVEDRKQRKYYNQTLMARKILKLLYKNKANYVAVWSSDKYCDCPWQTEDPRIEVIHPLFDIPAKTRQPVPSWCADSNFLKRDEDLVSWQFFIDECEFKLPFSVERQGSATKWLDERRDIPIKWLDKVAPIDWSLVKSRNINKFGFTSRDLHDIEIEERDKDYGCGDWNSPRYATAKLTCEQLWLFSLKHHKLE